MPAEAARRRPRARGRYGPFLRFPLYGTLSCRAGSAFLLQTAPVHTWNNTAG